MIFVVALFTAAIGSASALMGMLAARLTADARPAWLGVAVGFGILIVLPEGSRAARYSSPTLDAIELSIPCLVVAFLVVALTDRRPVAGRRVVAVAVGAAILTTTLVGLGTAYPGPLGAASTFPPSRLGLSSAWVGLALAVAVTALCRRERALAAVATGVAALGAAHLTDLLGAGPLQEGAPPTVPVLRLVAVGLVLSGGLRLIWRALTSLDSARDSRDEELRLVAMRLERAVERDHELRTGLAGLAGAARLLGSGGGVEAGIGDAAGGGRSRTDAKPLDALMTSEIRRLEGLLCVPVGGIQRRPRTEYDVAGVLRGLVSLRQASGADVRLEVDAGLYAMGSPATLAQVMANVFANAERHAPGSPVRVTAMRWNARVVVRVRDFGPGVDPTIAGTVFEPGVRDARRGGSGLGLHVCRQMLAREDASIAVRTGDPTKPGCTIVMDLPSPEPEPSQFAASAAGQEGDACLMS
ncbi:HAMP domain-containing histidine kinase [Actinomycetospora endophytica]|uniref:histidine kinase n=1 Tax=Actinomycetospora endophytica TaxID=2291215 RepID=A0ABS8PGI2_9PSEU|nr:HAMP domain-containing sensor histidine kinase [Actinomycetospora endophytica]MCD2196104.1 HAMP domain-containing histidine kinase [Actinomycetospora endophytica]